MMPAPTILTKVEVTELIFELQALKANQLIIKTSLCLSVISSDKEW